MWQTVMLGWHTLSRPMQYLLYILKAGGRIMTQSLLCPTKTSTERKTAVRHHQKFRCCVEVSPIFFSIWAQKLMPWHPGSDAKSRSEFTISLPFDGYPHGVPNSPGLCLPFFFFFSFPHLQSQLSWQATTENKGFLSVTGPSDVSQSGKENSHWLWRWSANTKATT